MDPAAVILGFDAREGSPDVPARGASDWDARRREMFLLRLAAARPLSVDTRVWPSAFDVGPVPRPDFVGFHQDCWQELSALRAHLDGVDASRLPALSIVALDLQLDLCTSSEQEQWQRLRSGFDPITRQWGAPQTGQPAAPDGSWRFLGFDIADQWLTSGLSNCGFGPDMGLRKQWSARLDEHHLFHDRADALAFKHLSDQRVPEHAPFFVFGLWLIETRSA